MMDLYEVVVVDRATGKVVQESKGPWGANQADRIRMRMEQHLDTERFDVCVQRVAGELASVDTAGELTVEGGTIDGLQL